MPFLAAVAALAACSVPAPPVAVADIPSATPLEVLPAGYPLSQVRTDVLSTARARYGEAAVARALAAQAYIFVKRFYGRAPPPPPGAGPDWRLPTPSALLIREGGQWLSATPDGWRPAEAGTAADLERRLAEARLWSEPAYTPACPDVGAKLLVLKVPGRPETVRLSLCGGAASELVLAALEA